MKRFGWALAIVVVLAGQSVGLGQRKMDVALGEMDGWQATQLIKADARTSDIPIIALTAHATQGDREVCLAAGMDDSLSKPVRTEDLSAMLQHWSGKIRSQAA